MESTVEVLTNKLVASLEELVKNYRALLENVRREKELLLKADREKLDENNQAKENLLFKIRAQDALRSRFAIEMAQQLKTDAESPRLLEIAKKLGGPQGDRLRSIHAALDLLIKRITEINKDNETYAKSALKNLNGALGEIKDTLTGGKKTYERKGQYKSGGDQSGHFVSKEV